MCRPGSARHIRTLALCLEGKGQGQPTQLTHRPGGQTGAQVSVHLEDTLFLKSVHLPGLAPPTLAPGDLSRLDSQGSIQG